MVVTIVVLLILAGVTISLLLDENGIIKKSKDARREYGQAKANEQEDLSNLSDMIDEATAEPTPKIDVNTKAGENSTINGSSYREPDLVAGSGSSYDAKDTYYKTILGDTGTKEQLAQLFADEYKAMIESVSKYGGFYIGRYELSKAGVQKDKATLTRTNWYNLYKKCKELNASDKVETRMIWGCQWDVACNFIANKGDKKNITDSSSWGNYKETLVKADDGTTEIKASEDAQVLNTGKTTFTMANNIYDLAGNCYEWTQEAYYTYLRAGRGGDYGSHGSFYPASFRGRNYPDDSDNDYRRFSSHFNNK